MKKLIYAIIASAATLILAISCENETGNSNHSGISGRLVSNSNCKSFKSGSIYTTADSLSCVDYSYNRFTKKLFIKHINAGFQCSADSLYCNVDISNDTIIIQEFDTPGQNDCYCLYDLEIEINGVDNKKYQIKLSEPSSGNQEQINFGVDFSTQVHGTFCVTRIRYPWGK